MTEIFATTLQGLLEYVFYGGSMFVLLWFVVRNRVQHRKIQPRQRANAAQWMREVGWSVVSQFTFAITGLAVGRAFQQVFDTAPIHVSSWTSPLAIVGLTIAFVLFDDCVFSWCHRALHTKTLYRRFHLTHHRSVDVNPLTAFSFHPLEAFVNSWPGLILGLTVDAPFAAFSWFAWASLLDNLLGHNGFEWAPRWWHRVPFIGSKAPSMHHNLHHEKVRGNYGLYFTFWDRWCGTEFADYDERWTQLHDRIALGHRA